MCPVEAGQKAVVRRLGGLVDGVGGVSKNSIVDVKATTPHDVLVKYSCMFLVILDCGDERGKKGRQIRRIETRQTKEERKNRET